MAGSAKNFWFCCSKGHEWKTQVRIRAIDGSGCPYCKGQKVCIENCLSVKSPKVAKEWHPIKNGKLTPNDVSFGSEVKCWFKCKNGHEWKSTICNRTNKKHPTGCPYCSSRKRCFDNSVAGRFPEIAKEWHPTKNGPLTPNDVSPSFLKKCWFKCKIGHEWLASPKRRCSKKTGCPYCSNRKVCVENSLENKFPKIASEWHPTKNGKLKPKDIVSGSNKKMWFKCKNGHEWKTSVSTRTLSKSGCPYCAGLKVCKENCLKTIAPHIAKEWHPTKNGNLTPNEIGSGSARRCWFRCQMDHAWKARLFHRTKNGTGCPHCPRITRPPCRKDCLQKRFPKVAAEWHPTKNGHLSPETIFGSSSIKVWFKCKNNHEWATTISARTRTNPTGCPYCSGYKMEELVRKTVQNLLKTKFPKLRTSFLGMQTFDAANKRLKLAFEYDGEFHDKAHWGERTPITALKKAKERDRRKSRFCKENGWTLIRIHHSEKKLLQATILKKLFKSGFVVLEAP